METKKINRIKKKIVKGCKANEVQTLVCKLLQVFLSYLVILSNETCSFLGKHTCYSVDLVWFRLMQKI